MNWIVFFHGLIVSSCLFGAVAVVALMAALAAWIDENCGSFAAFLALAVMVSLFSAALAGWVNA
jgi:hypothetical protein